MSQFKLYGRAVNQGEDTNPQTLSTVYIAASPEVLRAVAQFILKSADEIEQWGDQFDHIHLQDEWSGWEAGFPDVIVDRY